MNRDRLAGPDARPGDIALDPWAAILGRGIDADVGRHPVAGARVLVLAADAIGINGAGSPGEAAPGTRHARKAAGRGGFQDIAASPVSFHRHHGPPGDCPPWLKCSAGSGRVAKESALPNPSDARWVTRSRVELDRAVLAGGGFRRVPSSSSGGGDRRASGAGACRRLAPSRPGPSHRWALRAPRVQRKCG